MISMRFTHATGLALIVGLTSINAMAGSARSISPSYEVAGESGETYKERSVSCSNTVERRAIRLNPESKKWCIGPDFTTCARQKIDAANKACSAKQAVNANIQSADENSAQPELAASAAEQQPATEPAKQENETSVQTPDAPSRADRVALQAELIELEQKRLALKQRQIDLSKRKLELETTKDQ